jgi:ATP-dependent Clp protease ATP-binding subunit ClpX
MDNFEVLQELDKRVYGHQDAKKALITSIRRSKDRYYHKWALLRNKETLVAKMNVLLLGQSGTGKTHLVESLADIMDFPVIRLDATNLTPSGNSDGVNHKAIVKLITENARKEMDRRPHRYHSLEGTIDQTVIFVDEIDKLGVAFDSSGNWNKQIQASLLTLVENKAEFSGVTWIFAGAFAKLYVEEVKTKQIGFFEHTEMAKKKEKKDITKAGIIPELAGRISCIKELDVFTKEDYRHILNTLLIPEINATLGHIDVDLTGDLLDGIVLEAIENKQGIRSMRRSLNEVYAEAEFNDCFVETRTLTHQQ